MTVLSQNCDELEIAEEKGGHFLYSLFVRGKFFKHLWFILMYSVWVRFQNICRYFYISKHYFKTLLNTLKHTLKHFFKLLYKPTLDKVDLLTYLPLLLVFKIF